MARLPASPFFLSAWISRQTLRIDSVFIDEIKVYARAGHGGKGCVAFQREKYRPKGGPSGGNGGRGGDVILEADHDLNNLIGQYYQPKLVAQEGDGGMGKGMDGHAGKDLVVKVPCGTLVWRLPRDPSTTTVPPNEEADDSPPVLKTSTGNRPMFRAASGARAMEIDLSREEGEAQADQATSERELAVDLTTHGQRFTLCKGGRGGPGNRNFQSPTR